MTAIRMIPAPVKRLSFPDQLVPARRSPQPEKKLFLLPQPKEEKIVPHKTAQVKREQPCDEFSDWCMPEEEQGYIKVARFDPL